MKEAMPGHYSQLTLNAEDGVTTLTLNRPAQLNLLGMALTDELHAALAEVGADSSVRALIITGAGRAFCAGVDLKERAGLSPDARWAHNRALNDCFTRLAQLPIPTIAAINGVALGGGCELTLACDLRLAADHAALALPEAGLGIIPGAGGTQRLPRLIGPARAKELIFTARRIIADTAHTWGLINQVATAEQLLPTAQALAATIARQSPLALAYAKAAIDIGLETSLEQGLRYETAAIRAMLAAEDYQIGLAAFAAKQPPEFPDLAERRPT